MCQNTALQNENKKNSKHLKHAEEKLALKEKEIEQLEDINKKVRSIEAILRFQLNAELRNLLDENNRSRQYINKLEDQINYLQLKQNEVNLEIIFVILKGNC